MFIFKSTYEEILLDKLNSEIAFKTLLIKWNDLVDKLNEKGGDSFLNGKIKKDQFSKEELRDLLILCHPDKHNGNEKSTKITQRIVAMRQK